MSEYNLYELQKLAEDAAKKAGKFLNKNKKNKKNILYEAGRDIKLEVDISTEEIIRKELSKSRIDVMGEELGGSLSNNLCWVVDPIDGTANYFRGLDQCCISIALLKGEQALIGVIYNFNNNELYSAQKSCGAYLNNEKIFVSDIATKSKACLTTGFPASESIESSVKFLGDLASWKKVRMFGSAALSCAYVASGKCDYYAEKRVYLWDFAAGICLVQEGVVKLNMTP